LTSGNCSWVNARRVSFDKTSFAFFFIALDLRRSATIVIDYAVIQEIEIREEKTTGSSAERPELTDGCNTVRGPS
jgi:hypothetical protein